MTHKQILKSLEEYLIASWWKKIWLRLRHLPKFYVLVNDYSFCLKDVITFKAIYKKNKKDWLVENACQEKNEEEENLIKQQKK